MFENSRKEIHIFVDNPNIYVSALPGMIDESMIILFTYNEFTDAITQNKKVIYTTQLCALSHMFIRMGYDIYLYDKGNIIKFGEAYLELLEEEQPIQSYGYYYMLDLYKFGELYQCE